MQFKRLNRRASDNTEEIQSARWFRCACHGFYGYGSGTCAVSDGALPPGAATKAHPDLEAAYAQVALYQKTHGLPGSIEKGIEEDFRLDKQEVMLVVNTEEDLKAWDRVTRPFQLKMVQGIHDHGEAKPISDAVHYVVVRQDGAEGLVGGAEPGAVQPIPAGWALWIRFYPNGHTIFERPPTDKDLFPGRENSFTLATRRGRRPMTGSYIPHQQLTQQSSPEIHAELVKWMESAFPDAKTGKSIVSDSTSVALHLNSPDLIKNRPLVPIPGVTEFGHLHEDGSMHVALSAEDRWELIAKFWGEAHPAAQWGINAVMLYAPRDEKEIEIAKTVWTASYRYTKGEIR